MPDLTTYVTPAQVATKYGVSTKTVRRWVRAGLLTSYGYGARMIRLDPVEVASFMRGRGAPVDEQTDALARSIAAMIAAHQPFPPDKLARLAELLAPESMVTSRRGAA